MANDKDSLRLITAWLMILADLCPGGEAMTKQRSANLALALVSDFPTGAFTTASARHCAIGSDFFPGFDSLTKRLGEWWAENRPATVPRAEPGSAEAALTGSDLIWWEYWMKHRADRAAYDDRVRTIGKWSDASQLPLARFASLIREMSPKAWAVISGSHTPDDDRAEAYDVARAVQAATASTRPPQIPFTPPVAEQRLSFANVPPLLPRPPEDPVLLEQRRAANPIVQAARAQSKGWMDQ